MKARWAILASLGWVVLIMGLGLLAMWYVWENRIGGRHNFDERAAAFGRVAGIVTLLGWGGIWGWWVYCLKRGKGKR